ncbi:hypothetical protein CBS76997_10865 [Aspergillus niger]|nr:hypothetical protein CBS13152_10951 [Aspergillus niger]KAI2870165.1 hypothetical protein CBS11852_11122 [Aspergillus niger]KAI2950844.1 hypothetical protein CBS147323_10635 [Aspergillus niger]KAI3034982.1 hypothetical protein CBS76997_10865 [Aspergillus niger]
MGRFTLVQPGLLLAVTPTNSPFSTVLYGTLVLFHTPLLSALVPLINAKSHNQAAGGRSIRKEEPIARPPQQPPRSLRRPYMRPHISGSGSRDVPSASSLENHEACLATVETLERENEALRRDKNTLSERLESAESAIQELLSNQHRCRPGFSERQATQQLVDEMQHTVADCHQRLRSPAGLPECVDPAALTTALPATTAVPDMWPTQEEEGGAFGDDHDMVPDSGNFAQLFQL